MKIVLTAEEILDRGLWEKFCEQRGYSVWCMNEGQMLGSEEFVFTEKQAQELGIVVPGAGA